MPTPIPISGLSASPSIGDNDITVISHKIGSTYSSYKVTIANLRQSSGNTITGSHTIAFGLTNTASSNYSTAIGINNNITGTYSYNTAVGYKNILDTSVESVLIGSKNTLYSSEKSAILGVNNTLSGNYSTIAGYKNTVTANNLTTIGNSNNVNGVSGVLLGSNNTLSYLNNVISVGTYNTGGYIDNILIGNRNTNHGSYSISIGNSNTSTGIAIGKSNTTSNGTTIGSNCYSSNSGVAIGNGATSRILNGINFSGPIFARKDNSEINDLFTIFCGSESIVLSNVISFTASSSAALSIISGSAFFVNEVGVILTSGSSISVQPHISFSSLLSSIQTSGLAVLNDREKFTTLNTSTGQESTLTASVDVPATATTMTGRFYWKGFVVETQ